MNIIVCVKQVPATHKIRMDPETNTIMREGANAMFNPFDLYAIEEALKIRDRLGGKVKAISMGVLQVSEALKRLLILGLDDAFLLNDHMFAGADTLATAYTLALGIKTIGEYDLIL